MTCGPKSTSNVWRLVPSSTSKVSPSLRLMPRSISPSKSTSVASIAPNSGPVRIRPTGHALVHDFSALGSKSPSLPTCCNAPAALNSNMIFWNQSTLGVGGNRSISPRLPTANIRSRPGLLNGTPPLKIALKLTPYPWTASLQSCARTGSSGLSGASPS